MPLPASSSTQQFSADQQISLQVTYWDTPFTVLEGGVPSAGMMLDVRQALPNETQAQWQTYVNNLKIASASDVGTVFADNTLSAATLTDGRTDAVIGYWAGGAPGHHGVTVSGHVAYHFRGYLRSQTGRGWFDSAPGPQWFLAVAGNGYVRINKVRLGGGEVTTIFSGTVSEGNYLAQGYLFSSQISDMGAGDWLDIWYVQTGTESWGGFVVKAVSGTKAAGDATNQTAALDAPVLSCGLIDDNAPPSAQTVKAYQNWSVSQDRGRPAQFTLELPLVNPNNHDGEGWTWRKDAPSDPSYLMYNEGNSTIFAVRRKRLVQVQALFQTSGGPEAYTIFTGHVDDFAPPQRGVVQLTASGFEARQVSAIERMYPDPVSYMARGYRQLSGETEPCYGVVAYDNWPLEYAIRDLALRSGIDESRMRRTLTVPKANGTTATVTYNNQTFNKLRARSLGGSLIRLERPVHYGNAGVAFTEDNPVDDPYLFKPEATKDLWTRSRELSERLGYELRFDETGDVLLRPRNNPHAAIELTPASFSAGSFSTSLNPSAYGATYVSNTSATNPQYQANHTCARVDVVIPKQPASFNAKSWNYTVVRVSDSVTVASGTISGTTAIATGGTILHFFDALATKADGTNECVTTLYSGAYDTYQVTLSGSGTGNWAADCLLVYHTDPLKPILPQVLSTSINALSVQAQSAMDEMRNAVTVVGRRKATVTDSEKLGTNPNNPESEFVVSRAVDVDSLANRNAANYVGQLRESLIFQDDIADNAYAEYLARVFVYRYRNPLAAVQVEHTLIPMVQLGDPVWAEEQQFKSVDGTSGSRSPLFVTGLKHSSTGARFTTSITTSAYPEFPSFEPRDDVNLANFNGKPVVNVNVSYTSLTGHVQSNLGAGVPHLVQDYFGGDWVQLSNQAVTASPDRLVLSATAPWPPVPGTMFLQPKVSSFTDANFATHVTTTLQPTGGTYYKMQRGSSLDPVKLPGVVAIDVVYLVDKRGGKRGLARDFRNSYAYYTLNGDVLTINAGDLWGGGADVYAEIQWYQAKKDVLYADTYVTNTPYHHFFDVDYRDAQRKIFLPWRQGDGSATYTRNTNITAYDVVYRKLGPVDGSGNYQEPYTNGSPFFDPYTSELGYLVQVRADFLKSAKYRVSIRAVEDDTVVAWLTEPNADPSDENAHYQYFTAGANRTLYWDGVDSVGNWNERQSQEYAQLAYGAFEQEQAPTIGRGFYVWNREFIGGAGGAKAPLALLSGERDSNGVPVWGHGTFATWYVKFECKDDDVLPVVDSKALDSSFNGGSTAALVYTHLPTTPTRAELTYWDWKDSVSDWDGTQTGLDTASNWASPYTASGFDDSANPDARIHNAKPVRVRFKVQQRPGTLFSSASATNELQLKLVRHVKLRASIFDQVIINSAGAWPGTTQLQQTIANRRFMNDAHVVRFEDSDYRKASSLKWNDGDLGTEWVFTPKDFKRPFTSARLESIDFGNYLQLEEVPKWDANGRTQVGAQRSRLNIAFMSYLFYLSAYTTDRSGRMVWCANRQFLDQSKITTNTYGDWWDPASPQTAATATTFRALWPEDPTRMHRRALLTRQWTDEPGWKTAQMSKFGISAGSIGDNLLRHKWKDHSPSATTLNGTLWSSITGLQADNYSKWHRDSSRTQLPSAFGSLTREISNIGTWTFEASPTWNPCVTRDFHGFYLLPPMVDEGDFAPGSGGRSIFTYIYQCVDTADRPYTGTQKNTGDDPAGAETWSSPVWDKTTTYSSASNGLVRFWPGHVVASDQEPVKSLGVGTATCDYLRQDEMVHYEELRGLTSRGPRPAEGVIKVAPTAPYYVNMYDYDSIGAAPARNNFVFPLFSVNSVTNWFSMKFRSEYVWESAAFFPVTQQGGEDIARYNNALTRFPYARSTLGLLDAGAWTGWKDDLNTGNSLGYVFSISNTFQSNPFESGWPATAVGPVTPQTKQMIFHLVLVNERRAVPLF